MPVFKVGTKYHNLLANRTFNGVIDHADKSVLYNHISSLDTWKKSLAHQPALASEIPLLRSDDIASLGSDMYYSCSDGRYYYFTGYQDAIIYKFDSLDLSLAGTYQLHLDTTIQGDCSLPLCSSGICFDGTYLYACYFSGGVGGLPGRIIKIDPVTMTRVADYYSVELYSCSGVPVTDGTYLYAPLTIMGQTLTTVGKFNISTMALLAVWSPPGGCGYSEITGYDGKYVYSLSVGSPSIYTNYILSKINPVDMTTVDTLTGSGNFGFGFCFNGSYGFVSSYYSGKVFRINLQTMTESGYFEAIDGDEAYPRVLVSDGKYIYYLGAGNQPSSIVKLDPATMTRVSKTILNPDGLGVGMGFDGKYIFAFILYPSLGTKYIIKKILRDVSIND